VLAGAGAVSGDEVLEVASKEADVASDADAT
jgi:hypothetical protein